MMSPADGVGVLGSAGQEGTKEHSLSVGISGYSDWLITLAIQSFTNPAMFATSPVAGSVVLKIWRFMSGKDSPGSGVGVTKGLVLEVLVTEYFVPL